MKVYLGDLRYITVGRHSSYMPIAIGYIASYAKSQLGDDVSFTLHADPDEMVAAIERDRPDVVALSNYCWNAELSRAVGRYAKKLNPDVIIIAGGPEFPTDPDEIADYLAYRDEVSFYIYNYEAEVAFTAILTELQSGTTQDRMKTSPPLGVTCRDAFGQVNRGEAPKERLKDMDIIPSPILSGMMDPFLSGDFMPFLETTRGCPYACTFCVQGNAWYNKVYGFSTDRVKEELEYFGTRMSKFPDVPLCISDSNFGMFKRDLETAEAISDLQDKYDWPRSFLVDTGKSQEDRLIAIALKLKRRMSMSISPQTLNPETLKTLKRKNLGEHNLKAVYDKFKENGILTNAAIIVPLPHETKETYIEGLRILSDSHVEQPLAYTTMLLKGTTLASKESRLQHEMKTRYRMLPRQFGEICGQRIFEYDEVCIATNTISFDEYMECRGVSFVLLVLSTGQFDFLRHVCDEVNINWFDMLLEFWHRVENDEGAALGQIYKGFINASHDELFDSPKDIQRLIDDDENYKRLLSGELGENVMRNFVPKMAINCFTEVIDEVFSIIKEMGEPAPWMDAVLKWACTVRDIKPMLDLQENAFESITIDLNYDVPAWYNNSKNKTINNYKGLVRYELTTDQRGIESAVNTMKKLYGPDPLRWSSRLIEMKPMKEIWRKCQPATAMIGT